MVPVRPIRLHFGYKTTDAPWGGANNFLRALRTQLALTGGYQFVESADGEWDLLFMNQLSTGPGAHVRVNRILSVARRPPRRLVVRAVNLNRHAFPMGIRNRLFGTLRDRETLILLNAADRVVFQSEYQRGLFLKAGYAGRRSVVIHNGAGPAFRAAGDHTQSAPCGALRVATCTMSARSSKRHDLIVRLAEQSDVEVLHFGNWPETLSPGRVRLEGVRPAAEMATAYAACDYFFHPAVKDPCPNAVFEALCSGLPVIYNPGPGSSAEIVGEHGFPLNERDLAETVSRARALRPALSARVLKHRDSYTIERAARQYDELFRSVAAEG